jgi:protein-disulfide isomerase
LILARFYGTFFCILLLLVLANASGTAQAAAPAKKNAAAAAKAKPEAEKKTAPPAAAPVDPPAPLTPEVTHRIRTEIRSQYSVPSQVSIAVSELKTGSIPGYDNVVVTFTGGTSPKSHDFLISKDRKTLAHLQTFDISQDLMSKIDMKGRPVKGNPDAKVTIVNYDDFQCPFCSRMHSTLFVDVFKDYADRVRVVYKDYPLLEIHPWALRAAIDGNCLGEQNSQAYWDFADYVHANQKVVSGKSQSDSFANLDGAAKEQAQKHQLDQSKLQACMQKQDETAVRASMAEGDKLGVDSTPTLFVNGERFTGAVPEQELRSALNRALADAGQQVPASAKK